MTGTEIPSNKVNLDALQLIASRNTMQGLLAAEVAGQDWHKVAGEKIAFINQELKRMGITVG